MTTKDQERKALAQIRKIVESLGENSYIGMAFEGCFEIAEENIDNDFGCSLKQQVEAKNEQIETYVSELNALRNKADKLEERAIEAEDHYNAAQGRIDSWVAKYHEVEEIAVTNWNKFREQEDKVSELENEVMKLKAMLFDYMVKK